MNRRFDDGFHLQTTTNIVTTSVLATTTTGTDLATVVAVAPAVSAVFLY